jgi:hypothetical protein
MSELVRRRVNPGALVLISALASCRGDGRAGEGAEAGGAEAGGSESGTSGADTQGEPAACEGVDLGPRQLRLLTRREYDSTIRDLFALPPGAGCEGDACAGPSVACARAFELPTGGESWASVHVAGSFNAWASTPAAGGWALVYDEGADLWRGEFSFDPGTYQYKFVVDGATWLPDPGNPDGAPDGFGGENSVLVHTCPPGQAEPFSPSALLPAESRPEGFAFANNAAAGLVTAVHADAYLRAAERVAEVALAHRDGWLQCEPGDVVEVCAEAFVGAFGRRAFRRPLSAEERARYVGVVTGAGELSSGLREALQAMLISPNFLYRREVGGADGRLGGDEVATALSYTLWGTMPDQALFDAADAGALDSPAGVEVEVRRLLADPRAHAAIGAFAVQWLGVEPILTADKSVALFPGVDAALRRSMLEETRRFVTHVVLEDGRPGELFAADYSFLDPALAALYGVPAGEGEFAASPLPATRAGLLGHASVLGTYAHSDQSSPIRRGLFVRRSLLCQEFGPPPPNAGGVPEVDPKATTRERFRQHSDDDFCRSCHQYIDELGFGFERFDALGRYREQENGMPVEAGGDMNDLEGLGLGTHAPYTDLRALGAQLAAAESPRACLARQFFRYSRGHREGAADVCAVEALTATLTGTDDLREMIVAALTSPGFLHRK